MFGKVELIGVDIGEYAIKVARVKGASRLTINQLAYEVIPPEVRENRDLEVIKSLVATAIKKVKASRGQPVIHVNAGDAILREIRISEELSAQDLEGRVELELSDMLPFGIDQVYFDYDEDADSDGVRQTASVRKDLADGKVGLLAALPKVFKTPQVDIDAFAFGRVMPYLMKSLTHIDENQPIMVVDIGYSRSRFYVYENSELKFNREQQIGGQNVNEIVMDIYDVDNDLAESRKLSAGFGDEYNNLVLEPFVQMFMEQLNLAIDFYEATRTDELTLENVFLVGGGAKLAGFIESVNSVSQTQVMPIELSLISASDVSGSDGYGRDFILGIGLALEGGER